MNNVEALKARMMDLARVLAADNDGLALLGLGSIGAEMERLDIWSDLDFFTIVRPETKKRFLEDTSWLAEARPLSYIFPNTGDGFKLLWEDGIFGEMAVFEPHELEKIPFAPGKVWWARDGFDIALLEPKNSSGHAWKPPSAYFCLNELLTCLYVGLCRYRRGEKLSAWRFIQGHCLDRTLELAEFWEEEQPGFKDPYSRDRRLEDRFPSLIPLMESLLLGYDRIPISAINLLDWVESKTVVNQALAGEIRKLAEG